MKLKFLALMVLASFSVAAQAAVDNLIVNGDFESGNTGFASDLGYAADGRLDLEGREGHYFIGSNPKLTNKWFSEITGLDGSTNMMIINGSADANAKVWKQTVGALLANTDYFFSAWVTDLNGQDPAQPVFGIGDGKVVKGEVRGVWQQFSTTWNSGSNTSVDLYLTNSTTALLGNDFAVDGIALSTTAPVPEPETYALMGMGLLGLMAARRRKLQATK